METVKITLHNFQSFVLGSITLKKGLVILTSTQNNVGKSTVFRAIETAAKIHTYTSEDISDLVRNAESSIEFEFNNQKVELLLYTKKNNPSSFGYHFLHTKDKKTIQLTKIPKDLLDALGIIYISETNQILNMIDASQYNLFTEDDKYTTKAIEFLFLDQKVEDLKENLVFFLSLVSNDLKLFSSEYENLLNVLNTLEYNPTAVLFSSDLQDLEVLSSFLDKTPTFNSIPSFKDYAINFDFLKLLLCIIESLDKVLTAFTFISDPHFSYNFYSKYISLLCNLEILIKCGYILTYDFNYLNNLFRICCTLEDISKCISLILHLADDLNKISIEIDMINSELIKTEKVVICPVKGKVFYSDEQKCIPLIE